MRYVENAKKKRWKRNKKVKVCYRWVYGERWENWKVRTFDAEGKLNREGVWIEERGEVDLRTGVVMMTTQPEQRGEGLSLPLGLKGFFWMDFQDYHVTSFFFFSFFLKEKGEWGSGFGGYAIMCFLQNKTKIPAVVMTLIHPIWVINLTRNRQI